MTKAEKTSIIIMALAFFVVAIIMVKACLSEQNIEPLIVDPTIIDSNDR